jgi:hypothetical protein
MGHGENCFYDCLLIGLITFIRVLAAVFLNSVLFSTCKGKLLNFFSNQISHSLVVS